MLPLSLRRTWSANAEPAKFDGAAGAEEGPALAFEEFVEAVVAVNAADAGAAGHVAA